MLYVMETRDEEFPVSVTEAKNHLKVPTEITEDDSLIESLIQAATLHGEFYTSRDFRNNVWKLFIDKFEDRICVRLNRIQKIIKIEYLVSASLVTIANTVWYLKLGQHWSEILLQDGKTWPTDLDTIEHGIEITIQTEPPKEYIELIRSGLLLHIAGLYENRGDCDTEDVAKTSGANRKYDGFVIVKV